MEALERHVHEALDPGHAVGRRGLSLAGPLAPVGALQRHVDRAGSGRQHQLQHALLRDGPVVELQLLALDRHLKPLADLLAQARARPLRARAEVAEGPRAAADPHRHGADLAQVLRVLEDQAAERLGVLLLVPARVGQQRGELLEVQAAAAAHIVEVEDVASAHVPCERVEDVRRRRVGGRAADEEVVEVQLPADVAVHGPEVVLLLLGLAERVVLVHAAEALQGESRLALRALARRTAEAVEPRLQHVDADVCDLGLLEEALDLEVLEVEVPLRVDEDNQRLRVIGPAWLGVEVRRGHARHRA
mmetsp:Transcript_46576/g.120558  ORF Transcript_46576/g.120558 Transcript_46576/m.120558 type:complete len:304 (+) Transcript_46576:187-1098(+)